MMTRVIRVITDLQGLFPHPERRHTGRSSQQLQRLHHLLLGHLLHPLFLLDLHRDVISLALDALIRRRHAEQSRAKDFT